MPEPDRGSPCPELPRERERVRPDSRGTIFACIALLLMAAAPETPTSEVQKVPPEQALAVLGHMVADPEGKDIGRLFDILDLTRTMSCRRCSQPSRGCPPTTPSVPRPCCPG